MTTDNKVTLSGREPEMKKDIGAPAPVDPQTGMHKDYWILSDEERAKGFVRPVRTQYRHVGIRPKYALRKLTETEMEIYKNYRYIAFEPYPEEESSLIAGRYWTEEQLNSGCDTVTTMNIKIAETYARDPKFYGATFCCSCGKHLPVNEFVWGGTDDERIGS